MAAPTKPAIDYSYTGFAQGLGDGLFPGPQLDNDLAELADAISETIDFTKNVVRSDGALQNGVVTQASLAPELQIGVRPPQPWVSAKAYALNDTVTISNGLYACLVAHTSAVFVTDLAAKRWVLVFVLTSLDTPPDGAITTTKIEDRAVTSAKIGLGAVEAENLSPGLALLFVGASVDCDGPVPPPGWLFKFGQAVSRSTYARLLAFLTANFSAATTAGSPVITNIPLDLRSVGIIGAPVEGVGVPGGATVVGATFNTVTISANVFSSSPSTRIRIFPHGNGDGSTTFTLPDDRDRAMIGRGDMGGTAAGRVTNSGSGTPGLDTARLGAAGGVDRHTLTDLEAPVLRGDAASNGSHDHDYVDSTAQSPLTVLTDPGGASILQGSTAVTRNTAGDGMHSHTVVVNPAGGGAHPNLQPSRVTNKIIYSGVL